MDKNSGIGMALIAVIVLGFTLYQSHVGRQAALERYRADSLAQATALAAASPLDSLDVSSLQPREVELAEAPGQEAIFKDGALDAAYREEASLVCLENDKIRLELTTKGAQPYSVLVKDYFNYDSTALYLFRPGDAQYAVSLYAGELIRTSDFNFRVIAQTDSSVVMRLPFEAGGCIEQRYVLHRGMYSVDNELAFIGMDRIVPKNVGMFDLDFDVQVPRMEKGFKNESQYSKVDYYFEGDKNPSDFGRGRSGSKRIDSRLSWFAFQQQFFSTIVRAPQDFSSGELTLNFFTGQETERKLMACHAAMRAEYRHGGDFTVPIEFYFGPNHFQTLKSYGHKYEKIIPLGGSLVGWFTKYAIIPMFNFFSRYIANFGLIILLMTLVIKTVVLPLTWKSYASSAKMRALRPEIEKINKRYPKQEDAMKKQQATMDLYRRANVNMMGGCLPTLLTFPILWAMFRFFPASIELRQQPFLWCKDLSAYDSIVDFSTSIPLIGDHLSLFALLMALVMWLYSKMTMSSQPNAGDPSAKSMQFMTLWMMPVMMFFICNSLSAALSYYYLLSQLIAILQTWLIRKTVDEKAILERVRASEGKPVPKSKWQLRLEEAQRMQQQQMKNRK